MINIIPCASIFFKMINLITVKITLLPAYLINYNY